MKSEEAILVTSHLSKTTKMPCFSYSIPASKCITGSKLRQVKGSTCSKCYASEGRRGGFYHMPHVKKVMNERLEAIDEPGWSQAMISLILNKEMKFFRWHDSGDLQSIKHLHDIFEIAWNTPNCLYWLPTREWGMVKKYIKDFGMEKPSNLIIRLSAHMVDGPAPEELAKELGVNVSRVSNNEYNCPANEQDHKCLDCRKCWDANTFSVTYKVI